MSRSYPIWNDIQSCAYASGKSYGVKQTGNVTVRVGSSSSNSHVFLSHSVTHRQHDNGDREFRFYVDGACIKSAFLRKGASELDTQTDTLKQAREALASLRYAADALGAPEGSTFRENLRKLSECLEG